MSRLLTDSEHVKQQRMRLVEERKEHRRKVKWRSDEAKIEVAKAYLAFGGNATLTAAAMKVPLATLNVWKASNWWKELLVQLRKEERLELSAKTKQVAQMAIGVLEDRLQHGDYIYDQKLGQLVRKPVNMKDAAKVASDMLNRKEILDKSMEENVNPVSNEDRLEAVARKFEQLVQQGLAHKQKQINVTDVVYIQEEKKNAENESGKT